MKNNLLVLEFTESEFEEFKKTLEEKRRDYPKSKDKAIYEAIGDYLDSTFIPPSIGVWTKGELGKELNDAKEGAKKMDFEELQEKVLDWADGKDLLHKENAEKQFGKFIEEVFEFKSELDLIDAAIYLGRSVRDLKLEMGDILVTLIILAEQLDIDLVECLEMAYNKIKDRKGKTIDGVFVKEEEDEY